MQLLPADSDIVPKIVRMIYRLRPRLNSDYSVFKELRTTGRRVGLDAVGSAIVESRFLLHAVVCIVAAEGEF